MSGTNILWDLVIGSVCLVLPEFDLVYLQVVASVLNTTILMWILKCITVEISCAISILNSSLDVIWVKLLLCNYLCLLKYTGNLFHVVKPLT